MKKLLFCFLLVGIISCTKDKSLESSTPTTPTAKAKPIEYKLTLNFIGERSRGRFNFNGFNFADKKIISPVDSFTQADLVLSTSLHGYKPDEAIFVNNGHPFIYAFHLINSFNNIDSARMLYDKVKVDNSTFDQGALHIKKGDVWLVKLNESGTRYGKLLLTNVLFTPADTSCYEEVTFNADEIK